MGKLENKLKHLELVQGVVNRMSNNSFLLKGWAVTLVAGIVCFGCELGGFLVYVFEYCRS